MDALQTAAEGSSAGALDAGQRCEVKRRVVSRYFAMSKPSTARVQKIVEELLAVHKSDGNESGEVHAGHALEEIRWASVSSVLSQRDGLTES